MSVIITEKKDHLSKLFLFQHIPVDFGMLIVEYMWNYDA